MSDCNMLNFHANNSLLVSFSLGLKHLKSISLYIRHLIIQLMIFQNPHLSVAIIFISRQHNFVT